MISSSWPQASRTRARDVAPLSGLMRLWGWMHSPLGRKFVKYAMVSVVSTTVSQSVLLVTYGVLRLWPAVACNIVANAIATVPSYYLNRNWTWRKSGRSHLLKEMLPFWVSSFAGMALSILTVDIAVHFAQSHDLPHMTASILVNGANLFAFGLLWFLNFIFYNRVLFSGERVSPILGKSTQARDGDECSLGSDPVAGLV
ncbi:MAG: GtrA family protein [Acidimicrobiales bacterium]